MTGGIYLRGRTQWIWYQVGGERVFESAKTRNERTAQALLAQRHREIAAGIWTRPNATERRTFAAYMERWIARRIKSGVHNARDEARWLRTLAEPILGKLRMGDVRRDHIVAVWEHITAQRHHRTGEPWAPRTQRHAYEALLTLFADAVLDGLIASSPCTLRHRRGELPGKDDMDPAWRSEAVYSREEAAALLFDPRTSIDRRALYALMILCGMRAEEANGRRWRDYEPDALPLGRMTVRSQADGAASEKRTKTKKVRIVPVTPELAAILAEWRTAFVMIYGRAPKPDDPIVPSRRGVATHGAPRDVVGGYVRTQWPELCREVAELRLRYNQCDTWPDDDVASEQNGLIATPGAGLEVAPTHHNGGDPRRSVGLAVIDPTAPDASFAADSASAMQAVTHVTGEAQDRLPFQGWLPEYDVYLASEEWL